MSLPLLPDEKWEWVAYVNDTEVSVGLRANGALIAKRTRQCLARTWEPVIERIASDLWDDINTAARLSAKMGIEVIYE